MPPKGQAATEKKTPPPPPPPKMSTPFYPFQQPQDSSFGGFRLMPNAVATSRPVEAPRPPPEPLTIEHDIANGEVIPELASRDQDANIDITLRLTNEQGLTELPCFNKLPLFVRRVEFALSCAAVTGVAPPPPPQPGFTEAGLFSYSVSLESVDLSPCYRLAKFGSRFLAGCRKLKTVIFPTAEDRDAHGTVVSVSAFFMAGCQCEHLDLSYFSNLEEIPFNFLCSTTLVELDLSAFKHIKHVGDNFLDGSTELRSLSLPSGISFSVGSCFMQRCGKLEAIDLGFMRNNGQDVVPHRFLHSCSSLASVDIEPLSHVHTVSHNFLSWCTALQVLDLSSFVRLRNIEEAFLIGCRKLHTVVLPPKPHDGSTVTIGNDFLRDCNSLRAVELAFLTGTATIPSGFLMECNALVNVDLTPLAHVTSVELLFMAECTSLTTVNLSSWRTVMSMGPHILRGCAKLRTFIGPPVTAALAGIDNFLCGCPSLECVDLRFIHGTLGDVLNRCTASTIKAIAVSPLPDGSAPSWIKKSIPFAVQKSIIFSELGEALPQLQWSWKEHSSHPQGVQLGVLWMFAGLQHQTAGRNETRNIPAEVAYEICRYIGTPFDELLAGPSPQKMFGKAKTTSAVTKPSFGFGFGPAKTDNVTKSFGFGRKT